jgi:hypothetical protein
MSKTAHPYQDDKLGAELPPEAPEGRVNDPSYKTGKNEPVPVIDDEAQIEDPMKLGKADSSKQLGMLYHLCVLSSTVLSVTKERF